MNSILKKMAWIFLLFFMTHEVIIIADGLIDDKATDVRVAIIFGSKVHTDGTLSPRLKSRLDKGLQLYKEAVISEIYVSGGLGKEGYYEGTVMAKYLMEKGVSKNAIKMDNNGINTRNTALNFVHDYPNETRVYVVSQYFHITRCKMALKQVGVVDVYGAHGDYFEIRDPYAAFREFVGFYKYLLYY